MPRALVAGGAGFLGSHLCDRLLDEGFDVLCLDSLVTGDEANLADSAGDPRFEFLRGDLTQPLEVPGPLDWVLHLASPASPPDYLRHPIETLKVGAYGTFSALELARTKAARFLFASTSEVYGDPQVHPQPESYWGNVNPIGPRSVYDEAKRFAEATTMAFKRTYDVDVKIVRIFNTYGPRMRKDDGRAVPTFIEQALKGEPLTVHGDGTQTRSLCYVDDLIEGIWRMMGAGLSGPVNLGNPEEVRIIDLARRIAEAAGSASSIVLTERPTDDPELRCPDITLARRELGWSPQVPLQEGLVQTIEWARHPVSSGAAGALSES